MKRTHQSSNGFKTKKPSPASRPHRTLRPADRPEPRTSWGSLEGSHWEAKGKKGNHSFTPANSETNLATMVISSECAATLTLDSSTRRANGFQRGPAPPPPQLAVAEKNGTLNGALVSRNMDQNLRTPPPLFNFELGLGSHCAKLFSTCKETNRFEG